MLNADAQPHGVMEGKGSYNRHAKLPAGGAGLAMPLLEKAVQSLELEPEEQSIVIADYGSSQGKNSMPLCGSPSEACDGASAQIEQSLSSTLTNRRMTSPLSSLFSMLTRTGMSWTSPTYFLPRLEGPSTKMSSRLAPSTWDGPPMPRCGSAGFPHSFPATSFISSAPVQCVLNSNVRAQRTGKRSFPCERENCAPEVAWS